MRSLWIVPLMALAAGCGGEAAAKKPKSTEVVKPPKPKPRTKAKKSGDSGFAFGEDEAGGASKRVADPKKTMAPPMGSLDDVMRQAAEDQAPRQQYVCQSCGQKSPEAGVCCGKDRVPLK